jgi:methyltransferase
MGIEMSGVVFGLDSRIVFTFLIGALALQRVCELRISSRNQRALEQRGAVEFGAGHYPWMVLLHTAFLLSCLAEVWLLDRPWRPAIAVAAFSLLAGALALRWWTLATLGERWTTRVLVVPGEELISSGPSRWFRHPNYLVVMLEIAAIPMVHFAWLTAVVFSVANLLLLRERVRVEEDGLHRLAAGRAT